MNKLFQHLLTIILAVEFIVLAIFMDKAKIVHTPFYGLPSWSIGWGLLAIVIYNIWLKEE